MSVVSSWTMNSEEFFRVSPSLLVCLAKVSVIAGFIFIPDYCPEKDDGNWTCVAGLVGKNGYLEEAWDNVRMWHVSRNMIVFVKGLSIAAIGTMLIIVVLGILGYIFGRYILRLRPISALPIGINEPIKLQQVYYSSKSLQPKFDT